MISDPRRSWSLQHVQNKHIIFKGEGVSDNGFLISICIYFFFRLILLVRFIHLLVLQSTRMGISRYTTVAIEVGDRNRLPCVVSPFRSRPRPPITTVVKRVPVAFVKKTKSLQTLESSTPLVWRSDGIDLKFSFFFFLFWLYENHN